MTEQNSHEYIVPWYSTPCQVSWYNYQLKKWEGGIAYFDHIICCDNGDLILIDEVIQQALHDNIDVDDAIIELEWISISEAIWH